MRTIAILFTVMIALALCYQGGRWLENTMQKPEARGDYTQRYAYDQQLELDGVTYRKRKNVSTILLMGIDAEADSTVAQGYRNGGQVDFLRLLVINDADKSIEQIQIDRDTMTPITVLGVLGNKSGVRTAQICLAHGFGDGKKQSCELTMEAVSDLLLGIPIDSYIAMNLDGISVLNDRLGGITVTLDDDFSSLDPEMTSGTTLTLTGKQAELFVRSRRNIGIGTNEARMARQELFVSQMTDMLMKRIGEDKEFVGGLFDELEPYVTTNFSRGWLINKVWAAKDYEANAAIKLQGVHSVGSDGFMQFHADETALQRLVIELFFEKMK